MLLNILSITFRQRMLLAPVGHITRKFTGFVEKRPFNGLAIAGYVRASARNYATDKNGNIFNGIEQTNQSQRKLTEDLSKEDVRLLKKDPDIFGTLSPSAEETDLTDMAEETIDIDDIADSEINTSSIAKYTDMMKEHIQNNRIENAIDVVLVRMLKEDGVKPKAYLFNWLIDECVRFGLFNRAFDLYSLMKKLHLKISIKVFENLFIASEAMPVCVKKTGELRKTMAKNGLKENEAIFNAMIRTYVRAKNFKVAFQLANKMTETDFEMDLNTINHMVEAHCSDKENGFRCVLQLWHEIQRRGLQPDINTFIGILICIRECELGSVEKLKQAVVEITAQSIEKIESDNENPEHNESTSSETALLDVKDKVFNDGTPNLLNRPPCLGTLIALDEKKNPEHRLLLLGGITGITKQMQLANVPTDIKFYIELLQVAPSTVAAEQKIISNVKKNANVEPNLDLFNALMTKRGMRGNYEAAKAVIEIMEEAGVEADIVTYGLLSLGCRTKEDTQDYLQLLYDKGFILNIDIIDTMLKNACAGNDVNYVLEILHVMQVESFEPSRECIEILDNFNAKKFQWMHEQRKLSKHDKNECFKFLREYKGWKKHFRLGKPEDALPEENQEKLTNDAITSKKNRKQQLSRDKLPGREIKSGKLKI